MMDWDRGEPSAAGWVTMFILMLLFAAVLVTVGFALLRTLPRGSQPGLPQRPRPEDQPLNPLELLEQRLARGDIEPDDYERRRLLLTRGMYSPRPPGPHPGSPDA